MSNLEPLGRFQVKSIPTGTEEDDIRIEVNLPGTPLRFTINEALENPVTTATLVMLNANIDIEGIQQNGVMGEIQDEDHIAKYGVVTTATKEPVSTGQSVTVKEYCGRLGNDTTTWTITSVTSYVDGTGIPYYEVSLVNSAQAAVDALYNPRGSTNNQVLYIQGSYYEALRTYYGIDDNRDGYIDDTETTQFIDGETIVFANGANDYINAMLNAISGQVTTITSSMLYLPSGALCPLERYIAKGESCFQVIQDICAINGYLARYDRYGSFQIASATSLSSTSEYNLVDFNESLQQMESMEGVANWAICTGSVSTWSGQTDATDGGDSPESRQEITCDVYAGYPIGHTRGITVSMDSSILLGGVSELRNYGARELAKTAFGAYSATYSADNLPLEITVGTQLIGIAKYTGKFRIVVTGYSRTTDAQANKVTTSISGGTELAGTSTGGTDMGVYYAGGMGSAWGTDDDPASSGYGQIQAEYAKTEIAQGLTI
jgi:hypothetical protein